MTDFSLVEGATIKPVDGLWPVERLAIPQLAQVMFEEVTGKHPSQIDDAEREKWIRAMERVCDAMAEADNIRLFP